MAANWKKFIAYMGKLPLQAPLKNTLNGHSRRIFIADAPSIVPNHL